MNHNWEYLYQKYISIGSHCTFYKCNNCKLVKQKNSWSTEYIILDGIIIGIISIGIDFEMPTCGEVILRSVLE